MLKRELKGMTRAKNIESEERNTWQEELKGGQGEPWTYDSFGFDNAWWTMASVGRSIFRKKWGTIDCKPSRAGKKLSRIWNSADDFQYGQMSTNHHEDLGYVAGIEDDFKVEVLDGDYEDDDDPYNMSLESSRLLSPLRNRDDLGLGMEPDSSKPVPFSEPRAFRGGKRSSSDSSQDQTDPKTATKSKPHSQVESDAKHPTPGLKGIHNLSRDPSNKLDSTGDRDTVFRTKPSIPVASKTGTSARGTPKTMGLPLPEETSEVAGPEIQNLDIES
ncbi:hypothetical protein TWF718_000100 [Orbilia javanica]|uniref:Uncharacterized protein n=1 Tax=Orbilia javanica TaxID=47235 RepID=A0AAN8RLR2_9PEZI